RNKPFRQRAKLSSLNRQTRKSCTCPATVRKSMEYLLPLIPDIPGGAQSLRAQFHSAQEWRWARPLAVTVEDGMVGAPIGIAEMSRITTTLSSRTATRLPIATWQM